MIVNALTHKNTHISTNTLCDCERTQVQMKHITDTLCNCKRTQVQLKHNKRKSEAIRKLLAAEAGGEADGGCAHLCVCIPVRFV